MKQPHYDFEIAKISQWCRAHGYTCHVSLAGHVELRKKCLPEAILPNISLTPTDIATAIGRKETTAIGARMLGESGMVAYGPDGADVAVLIGIPMGQLPTKI